MKNPSRLLRRALKIHCLYVTFENYIIADYFTSVTLRVIKITTFGAELNP